MVFEAARSMAHSRTPRHRVISPLRTTTFWVKLAADLRCFPSHFVHTARFHRIHVPALARGVHGKMAEFVVQRIS